MYEWKSKELKNVVTKLHTTTKQYIHNNNAKKERLITIIT